MSNIEGLVGQPITRMVCDADLAIRSGIFHLETPVGTLRVVWIDDQVRHAVLEPPTPQEPADGR